ncbi:MAG: cell wall hydrolase [Lachnospiraceae bacterium]|nr:cell wall hydrolase [Lachnospiraceae bacterium]
MNKRTKLKLQNAKIYLKKNIFNGRYIVRNILASTIIVTVAAGAYGVGALALGNKKEEAKEVVETSQEEQVVIDLNETSSLNSSSISILMADMDAGSNADIEARESEMLTEAYKEFENKCVSVSDNVNVREKADTDSKIVGKMNNGAVAVVNSVDGEWLNITSGDVTGYVNAEFVKTGNDAFDYAKDFYDITAVVTEDGVNIRKDASKDADVIAAAYTGVVYDVDKEATDAVTDWVCISVDSSNKGYVSADYVEVTEGYPVAVAFEDASESNKNDEKENDKKEEKKDNSSEDKKQETTNTKTTETQTTEVQTTEAPTTEAPTTEVPTTEAQATDNQTTVPVTARGCVSLSEDDIYLMAAVMTLECGGESYEGQLAVANVILNRLQSGRWGSTMSDVVYAPRQFTVVNSANFNTYVSPSCLQAARDACAGTNNIGGYMSFRPLYNVDTSSLGSYTIIGNHCFF